VAVYFQRERCPVVECSAGMHYLLCFRTLVPFVPLHQCPEALLVHDSSSTILQHLKHGNKFVEHLHTLRPCTIQHRSEGSILRATALHGDHTHTHKQRGG
jgi:hypothetical protein